MNSSSIQDKKKLLKWLQGGEQLPKAPKLVDELEDYVYKTKSPKKKIGMKQIQDDLQELLDDMKERYGVK